MGHFTEEGLRQIKNRIPHVPPESLTSGLWEAIAHWVLGLLPQWMSPSLIALIAMCILFSGYAAFMLFPLYQLVQAGLESGDWSFQSYETTLMHDGLYIYAAVTTFAYLVLKAAVRIRALDAPERSALVEIVDHSCDSLSITFLTLTMAAAVRLGASTETVILFCSVHAEYYISNWANNHIYSMESHHEGSEPLSGVKRHLSVHEGLTMAIIAYCYTLHDSFIWRTDVGQYVPGLFGVYDECPEDVTSKMSEGCFRLNQALVYIFAAVAFLHCLKSVLYVRAQHHTFEDPEAALTEAYKELMPLFSACTATVLWASWSPTGLFQRRPDIFFIGTGSVLGNVNIRLMTANLSKQKFSYYPYMLILLSLCCLISVLGGYGSDYYRDGPSEDLCLLWFFFNAVSNLFKIVSNIANELCRAMDASVFVIEPKGTKRA